MLTQIGQYRYTGRGCTALIENTKKEYASVNVDTDEIDTANKRTFQDVLIRPADTTFQKNQDYYLKVKIPQDMNYEMKFTVKLIKQDGSKKSYQYLKDITVNRGGTSNHSHNVVLYEKTDGTIAAAIPSRYISGTSSKLNDIYWDEANNYYYLGKGGNNYSRTTKINSVVLTESWRNEIGTNYGVFEMIFRPVEDGFNYILFEMERLPEDYNIQKVQKVGQEEVTFFGRAIDLDKFEYSLYQVNSLTGVMGSDGLDRIGVWGHSGLMLAVNGEEMYIGPSGFLEISGVTISSIGVVALDNDYSNSFTIDYEYTTGGE